MGRDTPLDRFSLGQSLIISKYFVIFLFQLTGRRLSRSTKISRNLFRSLITHNLFFLLMSSGVGGRRRKIFIRKCFTSFSPEQNEKVNKNNYETRDNHNGYSKHFVRNSEVIRVVSGWPHDRDNWIILLIYQYGYGAEMTLFWTWGYIHNNRRRKGSVKWPSSRWFCTFRGRKEIDLC